jgi:pimeloyl-ACP methyl ester carboxylesterase
MLSPRELCHYRAAERTTWREAAVVEIGDAPIAAPLGAAFAERHLAVDSLRIRYREAGQGPPLLHLPGAEGPSLTRAHDLLARQFRLISLDLSGPGRSGADAHHQPLPDLAQTIAQAAASLGLDHYSLLGASTGATAALWLAVRFPERVEALVLESPTAIRPAGHRPLNDAGRDPALDQQLSELQVPVLVLFGTADRLIPPETGRLYRETLPNCHFVLVYHATHTISADRPEAFAHLVGDFLERREQFVVTRTSGLVHP